MVASASRLPRPMTLSRLATALLLASLPLTAAGCSVEPSPAVEAGAKLKQSIDKASKLMAEAAVVDPEANRKTAEALRGAAASTSAPAGATASQKAAFAMVASQLQREAGRLDAIAAERAVSEQRRLALALRAAISNAEQLAFLQGVAGKESSEARGKIDAMLAESNDQIDALRQAIAKLESASEELSAAVKAKGDEAKAKELQAGDLRSKSSGSAAVEQASGLMKQAIRLHVEAAEAQMLLNQASSELLFCRERLATLEAAVERLQTAKKSLASFDESRKTAASTMRTEMERELEAAAAAATSLHAIVDGDFKSLHDSGQEALERAASLAQQGQSAAGDAGKSAKASVASAQLALARLCEQRALAAADATTAFDAMAAHANGGPWAGYAAALRSDRDQSIVKAAEALESAIGSMGESADPVAVALRSRVDAAKASLQSMKPAAKTETPAPAASTETTPADPAAPTGEQAKPADAPAEPAPAPAGEPASDKPADPPAEPAAPPASPAH